MSSYFHRGYEHRNGSYSRRRHKTAGFKRRKKRSGAAKAILIIIGVIAAIALVAVFIKYLDPFVDSIIGSSDTDTEIAQTADTPAGSFDEVDDDIFVSGGNGYLMFKGIDSTAGSYAAVINSIASSIGGSAEIYNMVVPTNYEFGLNANYKEDGCSQRDNLNRISSALMSNVNNIDVYDTLNTHKSEYIYYRTDENWTTLGAYCGFLEFADKSGFSADKIYPLEDMAQQKGIIKNFEGSYIQRTADEHIQPDGNRELLRNTDTIEFYRLDINYVCYAPNSESGEEEETELFSIDNVEENAMSVFPGNGTPLIRIVNYDNAESDEKLLVVKDSFAEPMIAYLVPGYNEVHVADVNLYKGSLNGYIRTNGITQVLFVSSITDANNSLYCQRLRDLFDSSITG